MIKALTKDLVLWSISRGLHLPQSQLDRVSELIYLKDLLNRLEIDCVLDVGANRGQFARELRRIGYAGLIVSFEPVSTEFRAMQESFKSDVRWSGYQLALGRTNESKAITIPGLTVMSSLLEPIVAEKHSRYETIEVRRLDEILPELVGITDKSRIFLKMDTQGYDLEVFHGSTGCLDQVWGIQSELSVQPLYKEMPHYIEALNDYEAAGFELFNLSVVNRTSTGGLLELNCFMRRA